MAGRLLAVAARFQAKGGQTFRVYEGGWVGSKERRLTVVVQIGLLNSFVIPSGAVLQAKRGISRFSALRESQTDPYHRLYLRNAFCTSV